MKASSQRGFVDGWSKRLVRFLCCWYAFGLGDYCSGLDDGFLLVVLATTHILTS